MTLRSNFVLIMCCGALTCSSVVAQSPSQTHGFKVKVIGPGKEPPSAQQMVVPYWTLEPGWDTELEMRNNMVQQELTITPVLRTADGQEISLPATALGPDQSLAVDLQDAVGQVRPGLIGHLGSYGSVVFRFNGLASANMFGAAMVRRQGHPIDFHFDGDDPNPGYVPGGIEGVWWLPAETSNDYLILSNTSEQQVNARVVLSSASGVVHELPRTIAPSHTERLSIRDVIGSELSGMGGVSVTYTSGHLSVAQIVFDETTGLAAIMKLFERDLGEKPASHILRAPMMALSEPDPVLAFPHETKLIPQILLWNAGARSMAVSPIIDWRNGVTSGRFQHPVIQLSPHQSRVINLSDLQSKERIPSSALWSTVTLSYTGTRSDLVAVALAYDQSNRYGLQTPFSEGTARLWKGSMWHVDSAHNTLITMGNGGSEPTTAQVTLFYNDGQGRYRIGKLLTPGQQLWLDIGQLVRNQIPDSDGHLLPPETMTGSYELRDMEHQTVGLLYEGKLVIDKTFGHASYGCAACCGYLQTSVSLVPAPFAGPVNIYNQDVVQAYDTCSGNYDDVTSAGYNWNTANHSVATLNSTGNLHTVAVGSTTGNTFVQLASTNVAHNCPSFQSNPTQQETVTPTISQNQPLWYFGGNAAPSGFTLGSTTVTLTASGGSGGSYAWSITAGTSKAALQGATTNSSVQITSESYSTSSNDVTVQLQYTPSGGSAVPINYSLTIDSPYKLIVGSISDIGLAATSTCTIETSGSSGYSSLLGYTIMSFLGRQITNIGVNETFASVVDDYVGNNWPTYTAGGSTSSTGTFSDQICIVFPSGTPHSLAPQSPLTTIKVDHGSQFWFIGSTTEASGVEVQSDTLQRYQDHGRHLSIVSPTR